MKANFMEISRKLVTFMKLRQDYGNFTKIGCFHEITLGLWKFHTNWLFS
ncbi:hypothetical protein COTS27_01597 [Spirochaetota bacterium]|nr:hypothetical protein COTS27_01597 [Spirochaetota bacterium]